jgi:putative endonuclease
VAAEWSVYLVRTAAGALYTGVSTDVERRFLEHQGGAKGARSLRGKGPLVLAFQSCVGGRGRAMQLERKIKSWPKNRKEALCNGQLTLDDWLPDQ